MSKSIYIGAYMTVPVIEEKVIKEYNSCPNKNCENHGNKLPEGTFCPKCGSQITIQGFEKIDHITVWDKLVDTDSPDNIGEDEFHIRQNDENTISYLMCNFLNQGTRFDVDKLTDDLPVEITKDTISEMIKNYESFHSDRIKVIRKTYGEHASHVKFGFITFWW